MISEKTIFEGYESSPVQLDKKTALTWTFGNSS